MIGRANPLTSTSSHSSDSGTHGAATGDVSDREHSGNPDLRSRPVGLPMHSSAGSGHVSIRSVPRRAELLKVLMLPDFERATGSVRTGGIPTPARSPSN